MKKSFTSYDCLPQRLRGTDAGCSAASGGRIRTRPISTTTKATAATNSSSTTTTITVGPWRAYRQALAAYVVARMTIAETFQKAVNAAQTAFTRRARSATTGAERSTARAAYDGHRPGGGRRVRR